MLCMDFFRATSLNDAIGFLNAIIRHRGTTKIPDLSFVTPIITIIILLIIEWTGRHSEIPFSQFKSTKIRRLIFVIILLLIFFMGAYVNPRSFIYFQF